MRFSEAVNQRTNNKMVKKLKMPMR